MSDESSGRPPRPGPFPIRLQIDDDVAQGMYSNLPLVAANESEFVLDFAYVQPQEPKGKVRARVLLSPRLAKLLALRLRQRVEQYEDRYGEIPLPSPLMLPPPDGESIN